MSAPVLESRTPARVRSMGVSKRSRFVGFLVVMMLLGLAAAFLAPVYAGFRVVSDGNVDDRQATDAIVVLGAAQYNGKPSPVLKARLDHARVLYRRGVAPRIVTVGVSNRVTGSPRPGQVRTTWPGAVFPPVTWRLCPWATTPSRA